VTGPVEGLTRVGLRFKVPSCNCTIVYTKMNQKQVIGTIILLAAGTLLYFSECKSIYPEVTGVTRNLWGGTSKIACPLHKYF